MFFLSRSGSCLATHDAKQKPTQFTNIWNGFGDGAARALGFSRIALRTRKWMRIEMQNKVPNERAALEARMALCSHVERHWPGASESEC